MYWILYSKLEQSINCDDPKIDIEWPLMNKPIINESNTIALFLSELGISFGAGQKL